MRPAQILPNYFQKNFKSRLSTGSPFAGAHGRRSPLRVMPFLPENRHGRGQKKRSADLIVRQLREFYCPLTALRTETQLYNELLTRMNSPGPGLIPEQMPLTGDDLTIIKEKLMPIYREMINVFRTNMSVANPTVATYFYSLCKYEDSWDKSVRSAVPAQAWIVRGQTEKVLHPFYEHLHCTHNKLLSDYKAM